MALTKIQIGDTGTVAKAKIDAAFDVVDTNVTDIAAVESDIVDINAEIGLIKEDIVSIEEQQVLDTGDITTLKGDVADAKADIVTINSSISDINDGISSFNTNIENIHSYSELPNDLKQTITIESNVNKRYIKKTATSQEVTIDTTTMGDGTANGTIEIMLYDGDLSFVCTTAIDIIGALTYSAPALVEVKLMQNYLSICDISAVGGGGGNLPPIDDILYGIRNQVWTEIPESYYSVVDNIYEDVDNPEVGQVAFNKVATESITTIKSDFDADLIENAMCGVGDYIYSFGGYKSGSFQNTILKISTINGGQEILTETLPDGIYDQQAVAIGTDIYLFSGNNNDGIYNRVLKFDTLLEVITDFGAADGVIYTSITTDGTDIYLIKSGYNSAIAKYTVSTKTFSSIAFDPVLSISLTGICYVDGKIYMIGGLIAEVGESNKIFEVDVVAGDVVEWNNTLENTISTTKPTNIGDYIYFVGLNTKQSSLIFGLNIVTKEIFNTWAIAKNQNIQAFFTTKSDNSFIYIKYSLGDENDELIDRFNVEYVNEGFYIYNSYGWVYMPTQSDLIYKADKVVGAIDGNFAGLDINGDLTDSGYKPSDFALVDSYDLTHIDLTPLSNVITFTNTAKRNYAHSSNNANTSLVLDMDNENEHYILIENTSASSITIAVSGSNSETIIGSTAIIIPTLKYLEIGIVKHSTTCIVTEREI